LSQEAGCTGPSAGTAAATQFAGSGIPVSVPDNSTTTFYAQATGVGGTSDCSTPLVYTEVTPSPPSASAPSASALSSAFTASAAGTTLKVNVSSPGTVAVSDVKAPLSASASKKKKKSTLLLNPSSASGGPPTISVPQLLTKTAKQKLRQKGKVTVNARVKFTPTGGTAATQTLAVTIRGKKKKK